ncbi:MAG: bacteriorhodopsin [Solirubrobacteraceae bacterium]|jgi:bacteriorhodopsin|nr:bacteriorhodopsin [Solirubrobacteraceae bacterium]MDP4672571.1 bacteriorhodopsin [Solirubrobacteraceae bacterium]MDP4920419.1 bacteriorhodopsin [Solirubrobacteraceae bacterium]
MDTIMTSSQETWLWIGTAGMALGALGILVVGHGMQETHHRVTSFFVCAIAACLYLLMAQGQGDIIVSKASLALTPLGIGADISAKMVYFARYIDWVFTTPLLLLGLLTVALKPLTGGGEQTRERLGLIAGIIGADILMILTGLFGALSLDSTHKYVWFVVSCGFFLAILVLIWGPVRAAAAEQGAQTAALYNKLLGILTVLWFIYPVLWFLGTEGTGAISLNTEVAVFTIIDLTAKVGFGLLLVTGIKKMSGSSAATTAA